MAAPASIRSAEAEEGNDPVMKMTSSSSCNCPRQCSCTLTYCFCMLLVVAAITILLIMFQDMILWNTQDPVFRVNSAVLYPLNSTSDDELLSATWNFTLLALNPNTKLDLYYDNLQATLFYGPGYQHIKNLSQREQLVVFASTALPPFFLPTGKHTEIKFRLPVVNGYVGAKVAKEISDRNATALAMRFGLKISFWYDSRPRCGSRPIHPSLCTTTATEFRSEFPQIIIIATAAAAASCLSQPHVSVMVACVPSIVVGDCVWHLTVGSS